MHQIRFLRSFRASRVIKGSFTLQSRVGERPERGFAFNHRTHLFPEGESVSVRQITRRQAASLLVLADNPVLGEVVLDGAQEHEDFEVLG